MKRLTSVIAHNFQSFTDIDLEAESRKSGNGVKRNLFSAKKLRDWHKVAPPTIAELRHNMHDRKMSNGDTLKYLRFCCLFNSLGESVKHKMVIEGSNDQRQGK